MSETGGDQLSRDQLRLLNEAVKSLNSTAAFTEVLWQIAHSGRQLLDAKYGALGILRPDGSIAEFIVDGLSPKQIAAIGDPPKGLGLLGAVIKSGKPIRTSDIMSDPRRYGFPPNHPPMRSFLGVPIRIGEEVVGNLYVTEKQHAPEFTQEDEWIATLLAEHAGIAVQRTRLMAARESFIGVAAHELRTPVAGAQLAIETAIERAKQLNAGEEIEELLIDAKRYVEKLSGEMEELLDASRLEHGALVLRRTLADLRDICTAACDRMAWTYGEGRIERCLDDRAIPGRWDGVRLERSVANVLENALRYSARDTSVLIRASLEGNLGRVTVEDRGPGISQADLTRIWQPFARGSAHRGDQRGSGLGLYVVREMIEAHGGTVRIDSKLGKGTKVTIELPVGSVG